MRVRADGGEGSGIAAQRCAPKAIAFAFVAAAWLLLDQLSKACADSFDVGARIAGPWLGIIELRLAHNTGGAWSMLSDSTMLLAIISVIVCLVVLVCFVIWARELSWLSTVALALVFAGGIGNAIDRFAHGYVIDFLCPVIIDFPIFNVADIGITCGIALFVVSLLLGAHGGRHATHPDGKDA